jgi:hypothetical protein
MGKMRYFASFLLPLHEGSRENLPLRKNKGPELRAGIAVACFASSASVTLPGLAKKIA